MDQTLRLRFQEKFEKTQEIMARYELDTEEVTDAVEEMSHFQVTAPLVGGFSTGKSSLINSVIGEQLLSTNISPETAIPAEIASGDDIVTLIKKDGEETIPLSLFASRKLSANTHTLMRVYTSNEFFQQIPSVKLVDMPGFDSGIAVHNKAIDEYLPKSLAYILTVAADEGTLRESIITFLNELKIYRVPVYVVITKSNKVTPEQLQETKEHIADTVHRFLGVDHVEVAVTCAKGRNVDVRGFQNILLEIEGRSQEIFIKTFTGRLERICEKAENYLTSRLEQSDLSLEGVQLEKEKLEKNLLNLKEDFQREKENFDQQVEKCIEFIKNKILQDLRASASTMESMLLQGTDITEKINTIIRNAIASGMQNELEPKLKRYLQQIAEMVNSTIYGDTNIQLDSATLQNDEELGNAVQVLLTSLVSAAASFFAGTSLAASLGLTGAMLGPIGAAVGAVAGALISSFITAGKKKKQERERRELASQKVQEIIQSVSMDAGGKAETEIRNYVAGVNEKIAEELKKEKEILEKALEDTETKLREGTMAREQERKQMEADLQLIKEIKHGDDGIK